MANPGCPGRHSEKSKMCSRKLAEIKARIESVYSAAGGGAVANWSKMYHSSGYFSSIASRPSIELYADHDVPEAMSTQ